VVHSFTVVHRAPSPDFEVPYVVALVRLEEGPSLLTNIVGCAPEDVRCEQPVTAAWRDGADGRRVVVFTPA
jgi:uncharacterized OB-fold protein